MEPLGTKSYGSFPHLPISRVGPGDYHISEGQASIANVKTHDKHDLIIVQEKLDGFNVIAAKVNSEIVLSPAPANLASASPYLQHHPFGTWVKRNEQRFREVLQEGGRMASHSCRHPLQPAT